MFEESTSTERTSTVDKEQFVKPIQASDDNVIKKLKSEAIPFLDGCEKDESPTIVSASEENVVEEKCVDDISIKSDDKLKKKKFYEECKLCRKRFYCETNYLLHLEGSKHKRKMFVSSAERVKCDVCDIVFLDLKDYNMHINGKKHKRQTLTKKLGEKFQAEKNLLPADKETKRKFSQECPLRCSLCNKKFNNLITYDIHMNSAFHQTMTVYGPI